MSEWVLALMATSCSVWAYGLYYNRTGTKTQPNSVAWGISCVLALVNLNGYLDTAESTALAAQFFISVAGCIVMFGRLVYVRQIRWPTRVEWALMAIAACALSIVLLVPNRMVALRGLLVDGELLKFWCLIMTSIAAFAPTYLGVLHDPTKETALPWSLWAITCVFTLANSLVHWHGDWTTLGLPGLLLAQSSALALLVSTKRARLQTAPM